MFWSSVKFIYGYLLFHFKYQLKIWIWGKNYFYDMILIFNEHIAEKEISSFFSESPLTTSVLLIYVWITRINDNWPKWMKSQVFTGILKSLNFLQISPKVISSIFLWIASNFLSLLICVWITGINDNWPKWIKFRVLYNNNNAHK